MLILTRTLKSLNILSEHSFSISAWLHFPEASSCMLYRVQVKVLFDVTITFINEYRCLTQPAAQPGRCSKVSFIMSFCLFSVIILL